MQGFFRSGTAGARGLRGAGARDAFTLIEMIVVIVVMALLMGLTFRLLRPSEHAQSISATVKVLGLTNAAISEYQAEYGIYPPVMDPIDPVRTGGLVANDKNSPNDNPGVDGHAPGVSVGYFAPSVMNCHLGGDYEFRFGLVAYLVDRRDPDPNQSNIGFLDGIFKLYPNIVDKRFGRGSHWYERGTGLGDGASLYERLKPGAKELAFYRRIKPITKQIVSFWGYVRRKPKKDDFFYYTIRDGWNHDLVYICPPPYTSYALFSAGPDGKCVADDPLNPDAKCPSCGEYHNKDNVYSSVSVK